MQSYQCSDSVNLLGGVVRSLLMRLAASSESSHEATNAMSGGSDSTAWARRARERRASRMLVTEDGVAPADMGFLPVTGANRARHDVILTGTHGPVMGDESDAQSSLCVCDTVTANCKTAGR